MGRLNRSSVPFKGATCSRNCHGNLIRLSDVVLPLGVRVCVLGFSFPGKTSRSLGLMRGPTNGNA